jgi:hypothetical protein
MAAETAPQHQQYPNLNPYTDNETGEAMASQLQNATSSVVNSEVGNHQLLPAPARWRLPGSHSPWTTGKHTSRPPAPAGRDNTRTPVLASLNPH